MINLVAFLLGLSKTAIGMCAIALFVLFLLNLTSPYIRQVVLKGGLLLLVIVPVGLMVYQGITDQSFLEMLDARMSQDTSFFWRKRIWNYLLSNIDMMTMLTGHGFTAANAWVYQLSFHDKLNPTPLIMVHNGYLALLYDLGIMGWLLFVAALSLVWNAFRWFMNAAYRMNRPLLATIIALAVYFLLVCGFDEMTYMFNAPMVFWVLATLMYCLTLREKTV
jgi:hypothetical protein